MQLTDEQSYAWSQNMLLPFVLNTSAARHGTTAELGSPLVLAMLTLAVLRASKRPVLRNHHCISLRTWKDFTNTEQFTALRKVKH